MKLRRPTDMLAGCMWLPRFTDKVRHHLAGTLEPHFERPFCHPLATDGAFLGHFEIEKDEAIRSIAESNGSDDGVVRWFRSRANCSAERIDHWNRLGPSIGKEGFPMRRGYLWILRQYYGGVAPDPRVDSVFTAIAYDEGYLDEMVMKTGEPGATDNPDDAQRLREDH